MRVRRPGGLLSGVLVIALGLGAGRREASAGPPSSASWYWPPGSASPVAVFGTSTNSKEYSAGASAGFHGGPVVTNAHIALIFWGDYWTSPIGQSAQAMISSSASTITSGVYFSLLDQYIGPNSETIDGVWNMPGDGSGGVGCEGDLALQNALEQGLVAGHGPGTPNMIYVNITPPSTGGEGTCHGRDQSNGFGYVWLYLHTQSETYTGSNAVPIAPVPTTLDFTHEVVESMTDLDQASPAWTMSVAAGENEIADVCGQLAVLDGVMVRAYWSNAERNIAGYPDSGEGLCSVPFPAPPTVASVNPGIGATFGGNEVTVEGTGFDVHGSTFVTVGGQLATPVATCVGGTGTCCESTTACTVTVPASATPVACTGNLLQTPVPVQVTANGMPSNANVPYTYDEYASCVGVPCGNSSVYITSGQCEPLGTVCALNFTTNGVIVASGQCAGVGTPCASPPGTVVSYQGQCEASGGGCAVNGDAPGVWYEGECYPMTIECPAPLVPAGPAGGQYCAPAEPPSGGDAGVGRAAGGGSGTGRGGGLGGSCPTCVSNM
jgi:hypothetical protein